jgi:hypothetical protein
MLPPDILLAISPAWALRAAEALLHSGTSTQPAARSGRDGPSPTALSKAETRR